MKTLALVLALALPIPALAAVEFYASPPASTPVDLTAVTTDVKPTVDNSVSLGSSSKRWANTFSTIITSGALTSPAATNVTITSNVTDGSSAVGFVLNCVACADASSKPISIQMGGTEKWFFRQDGVFAPHSFGGGSLGSGALYWQLSYINEMISGNGTVQDGAGMIRLRFTNGQGSLFHGDAAANGVALKISNQTAITSGNILLGYSDNQETLRFKHSFDGSLQQEPVTLQTCASETEGMISRDSAAGASTGHRTRMCLCTSDGGGTPAYKWKNMGMGDIPTALGTTTTCPDDVN